MKEGALKTASEHWLEKSADKLLAVYQQALEIKTERKKRRLGGLLAQKKP